MNAFCIDFGRCRPAAAAVLLTVLLCYAFSVHFVTRYDGLSSCPPSQTFRRPNTFITEYDANVSSRLSDLVRRRSTAADPDLIRLIRDMMDSPSGHMVKMSMPLTETPQSREILRILKNKVFCMLVV